MLLVIDRRALLVHVWMMTRRDDDFVLIDN